MNKKPGGMLHRAFAALIVLTATSIILYNSGILPVNSGINSNNGRGYLLGKKEVLNSKSTEKQNTTAKQQPPAPAPPPEQKKTVQPVKPSAKPASQPLSRGGSTIIKKTEKAPSSTTSTSTKVQKAVAPSSPKPAAKPAAYSVKGNGRTYSITAEERSLMARLVSAEAMSESYEGKLAVATVVVNRVTSGTFPGSVTQVIIGKESGYYQFTPVLDGRINNPPSAEAVKAVDQVLGGYRSFPSKVMWFLNPDKSSSFWILNTKTYFKSIGNHNFYY